MSGSRTDNNDWGLFGITRDLINHFDPAHGFMQAKTRQEANQLKREFSKSDHPIAREIQTLLTNLNNFYAFSTVTLTDAKNQITHPDKVIGKLTEMADAIDKMQGYTTANTQEKQVIGQALQYCVDSIEHRLSELREQKEPLATFYDTTPNPLKACLSSFSQRTLAP